MFNLQLLLSHNVVFTHRIYDIPKRRAFNCRRLKINSTDYCVSYHCTYSCVPHLFLCSSCRKHLIYVIFVNLLVQNIIAAMMSKRKVKRDISTRVFEWQICNIFLLVLCSFIFFITPKYSYILIMYRTCCLFITCLNHIHTILFQQNKILLRSIMKKNMNDTEFFYLLVPSGFFYLLIEFVRSH